MPFLGAVVGKEFQTWLRGRFTFGLFGLLVLGLAVLALVMVLAILAPDSNAAPTFFSASGSNVSTSNALVANRALFLFGGVGVCVVLASAILSAAVASSAFAAEREQGTLDLLLLQGPGSLHLIVAKVLSSVLFSLFLLVVSVPLFASAWMFGGVPISTALILVVVVLAVTVFFSALGVFFAAALRSALAAAIFAQVTAALLLFGTLGAYLAAALAGGNTFLRPLLWLNPVIALLSAGGTATESFARIVPPTYRGAISLPPTTFPFGVIPAWATGGVIWLLLAICFMVAASVLIDPCHPVRWRTSPATR